MYSVTWLSFPLLLKYLTDGRHVTRAHVEHVADGPCAHREETGSGCHKRATSPEYSHTFRVKSFRFADFPRPPRAPYTHLYWTIKDSSRSRSIEAAHSTLRRGCPDAKRPLARALRVTQYAAPR
ncbi:hypothetical protein EVAR_98047_1 [Eumeta japonica]|uniref:Secreted protein n=1 Tax=Eumeta variegata TaxID=151549 RepID=A0A4C1WCT5_EUMVA|nr:hypothetical protein EVAR_98047_1 [Eumeta japonica]